MGGAAPVFAYQQGAGGQEPRPPTVVKVLVEGNDRYTDSQLISAFGQRVDAPLLGRTASDRGIRAVFDTFHVRVDEVAVRDVEGGVEMVLQVTELEVDLEPRFVGNVEISKEELLAWGGLRADSELYLYRAPRIRQRLLNQYRREGFYFAEVNVVTREGRVDEDGKWLAPDVIFEILEGPRVHVADLVIHGNDSMPDRGMLMWKSGLRKFADIETRGPKFFNLFKKEFVQETLDADLQAIRIVYRERGWLDAVVQLESLRFNDERDRVTIHIRIDEGLRYEVGSLTIEAVELYGDRDPVTGHPERSVELLFPVEDLLAECELRPGRFYETRLVERDLRSLRGYFGERGYISHSSLPATQSWQFRGAELVIREESGVVDVIYRIAQGRQQFIREVRVSGNMHTQDRVIRRRIAVEPGQVADLRKIERARQRIQSLGFFSERRPDVPHKEPTFRFVETEDPAWKDLEFIVEETEALSFQLSGGISSTTGLFGLIRMQKRNFDLFDPPSSAAPGTIISEIARGEAFHGAGQELIISASPGTEVTRFGITFREPDIFRLHTKAIGLDLFGRRRFRIFDSHDEQRAEFGFRLRRQLTLDSSVGVGLTTGWVDVDDLDNGDEPTLGNPLTVPKLLKDQEGKNDIAYLELSYDYTDLDNFFSPQNGTTFDLTTRFYDGSLGSEFEFIKTDAVWRRYGQFGYRTDDARPGYKLELTGGVAVPYGDSDDVPYSERYFLGGQRLRGFDFRGVGPFENDFPVGGETLLRGVVEYRHPLITTIQPGTFREIEVVRGGLFFDIGVLDPDPFELDLEEVRASVGFFVGLAVPLPITLSFGFAVKEDEEDDTRVLNFNIGF
ncbi:MAG: BamA/TamA family outer membrane protein [Planctomycetota bacterium]|nr:BamA/TamA family outer membrane protein [Planctomycetota bacterium]